MKKDLKTKAVKTYVGIENAVVEGYKSVETAAVNFGNSLVEEYDRLRQKQE